MFTVIRNDDALQQEVSIAFLPQVIPTGVPFGRSIVPCKREEDEFTDDRFRQPIPMIQEIADDLRRR